jgi:hypothetical protein
MSFPNRLPEVNNDDGQWGDILNQFLGQEHYNNDNAGAGDPASGGHQTITIRPGTTAANTAPIIFSSGPLMTTAQAGSMEFLTDKLYFTQTTSTTRKTIAVFDETGAVKGDIYYRDASGYFVALHPGSDGLQLALSGGVPVWSVPAGMNMAQVQAVSSMRI